MFLSAGLSCTSFLNREPARELFTDDIETDDAYANEVPDGCGVSPEVKENVVALFPDLLGENGTIRYLLEEALELTEFVRLRVDTGLFRSRCCRLSTPFGSKGVRLLPYISRISGGSCNVRGDIARNLASSNVDRAPTGTC